MASRTHASGLLFATITMIFFSKDGQDDYINMFAHGCGSEPVADFDYDASTDPIVLRGILTQNNETLLGRSQRFLLHGHWIFWQQQR